MSRKSIPSGAAATDEDEIGHRAPGSPSDRDPVHGVGYAFVPEGENSWVYTWMNPGSKLPEHLHPHQEERWEVLEGTARVQVGDVTAEVTPADGPQLVRPGVKHSLENRSPGTVHLRCHVLPAAGLQDFLEESAAAAREGLIMRGGTPPGPSGSQVGGALPAAAPAGHGDVLPAGLRPEADDRGVRPRLNLRSHDDGRLV